MELDPGSSEVVAPLPPANGRRFCLSGCFLITLLIIFKSHEYMSQLLGLSVDL